MSQLLRADARHAPEPRVELVRGFVRFVYISLGLFFVGLAGVGAVLPGLPTTPFLLLASYFFVRSSPRLEAWLLRNRVFGPMLLDWKTHRGVRPAVKIVSIGVVLVMLTLTLTLGSLPALLSYVVGGLGLVGLVVIARLPTIPIADRNTPRLDKTDEIS